MALAAKIVPAPEEPKKKEVQLYNKLTHGALASRDSFGYGGRAAIGDPAIVAPEWKFLKRTKFLRDLEGNYPFSNDGAFVKATDLPKVLQADPRSYAVFTAWQALNSTNARLPKFTRWVNSVYPDFKELHQALAILMQNNMQDVVTIDASPIGLFNYGNAANFATCLNTCYNNNGAPALDGQARFATVVKKVFEECAGIAVAYILDRKSGFMKGRILLHHVKSKKYGDGLRVANCYGCLSVPNLVSALQDAKKNFPILPYRSDAPYGLGGMDTPDKNKDEWTHEKITLRGEAGGDHWDTPYINGPIYISKSEYVVAPKESKNVL